MFAAIVGRLGGPYIAIALFAVLVGLGVQTVRVANGKAALATERTQRLSERAAAAAALAIEVQKNVTIAAEWQAKVDAERRSGEDAKRKNEELAAEITRLAPAAVDVGGLRKQLAAARGASATSSLAAAASCDARAGAYESLLADYAGFGARCVKAGREVALAHDNRAAEVVELFNSWPRTPARDPSLPAVPLQ